MKTDPLIKLILLVLAVALACHLVGCQKEHTKYRYTPKFNVGQLVQYEHSIEHDYGKPGKRLWDDPQPFTITSYYWNETWRDNWYMVKDANGVQWESGIDELSLQAWDGRLRK